MEDIYYAGYWLNRGLGTLLCKTAQCGTFDGVIAELYANEDKNSGALLSNNRNLLVLPHGFRHAAAYVNEIEAFLNT